MIYRDRRLGRWKEVKTTSGYILSVWSTPVARTRDDFVDCVVYLYGTTQEAVEGSQFGGSGFLVGVPPEQGQPTLSSVHLYAVTNKHVIEEGATVIRMNTVAGGIDVIPLTADDWTTHPEHDLAATQLGLNDGPRHFKFGCFMTSEFLSLHTVLLADIGIGDDVFMVGRFAPHQGKTRNAPVVRYGNISLMPGEPVPIGEGKVIKEGLLVEMRSLSGYSGSPVFWHRDPAALLPRDKVPIPERRFREVLPDCEFLLGVDCSHFPIWKTVQRKVGERLDPMNDIVVDLNSGQAVVAPAWHLLDLLNQRNFVMARKQRDAQRAAKDEQKEGELNRRGSIPDSASSPKPRGPEPVRLAIDGDWEEAAREALKKGKPPKDMR